MNLQPTESTPMIRELARRNARRATYYEDLAEIKANATRLREAKKADCGYITFDDTNITVDTLIAPIKKHSNHNHAGRGLTYAENMKDFLARPKKGTYLFNLHDVNEVPGSIGFGHKIGGQTAIIPDLYQMNNYNGNLEKYDLTPFEEKASRIIFAGATTGSENYNLRENDRVNYCKYVAERFKTNLNMCDFYITNIVQMDYNDLKRYVRSDDVLKQMIHPVIKVEDHYRYKYIFSIDGNAAAWDRPMWAMSSNSLLMQAPTKYEMWYSPVLKDSEHYLTVEKENLENAFNFCESNPQLCQNIINNAHSFVKNYTAHPHGYEYMHFFLEALNEFHTP